MIEKFNANSDVKIPDKPDESNKEKVSKAKAKIRVEANRIKEILNGEGGFEVDATVENLMSDNDYTWNIRLSEFEDVICEKLIVKMMKTVTRTLRRANMAKEEIEKVYLVGGSARIKKVKETLREFFG